MGVNKLIYRQELANNAFNTDPRERAIFQWFNKILATIKVGSKLVGGRVNLVVPGDCVARNRGADLVKHLVPPLRAGTRYWTRHREHRNQAALACTAHGAGQHRDYYLKQNARINLPTNGLATNSERSTMFEQPRKIARARGSG